MAQLSGHGTLTFCGMRFHGEMVRDANSFTFTSPTYNCPHCGEWMGTGITRSEPATVVHINCRKGVWIPPENEILQQPLKMES